MQYIKNFEWNNRKYNQKLPLSELIDAFMKVSESQHCSSSPSSLFRPCNKMTP